MFIVNPSRFTVAGGGGGGGGSPAATVSYIGNYSNQTPGTSHTITSGNIGSADYVLVVFHWYTSSADTVTSVTIGGTAATRLNPPNQGRWYIAAAPVDTTPDIVISYNGNAVAVGVAVYGLTNLESTTPTDTASNNNWQGTISVDVEAGGVVVYTAMAGSGPQFTFDPTDLHFHTEWYAGDDAEHAGWSQASASASSYSRYMKVTSSTSQRHALAAFR